ncbi:hypothetical protein SNOG_13561 [Parastagonospora nodorum SN15]|uniref:SH3 domain-containing protein n=2 Tax=Phaeosphaeria nodorum (strain SN15 / ATCC MYA-4574 / FGSC 10173) TaxID=321614 RepID=Q0U3V3_PHANO|nr:hypothetical protein SNOG_13561 [Parastagonospora nodorum SN15]EAT79008.2 hypothetical protein SNOG_13561 [Parastagonospora nodorum SN15]
MFKVKAVYDYSSPHEDDLNFKQGQVISVTEEEGDDWYVGEYQDDTGARHDGLFPRNFVERYEPAPPPRPNRVSRHKPLEQPAAQEEAPPTPVIPQESKPVQRDEAEPPKPQPPPVQVPPAAKAEPTPMSPMSPPSAASTKSAELPAVADEPVKATPATKKAPPPVAAKSNAFRDRIAAFNAPAAAPIQPFKAAGAPSNFIKRPFVAPPPSRNAYVPPPKEAPQVKAYRRDEDPEIAERQAQDQDAADRAGLAPHDAGTAPEAEEDNQPKISLKERIALLQKQQQESAERAAAAIHKDKPKRPPVKQRTESHEGLAEDSEDIGLEQVASAGSKQRQSMDHPRPSRTSHDIRSPDSYHDRELVSENDADQSGADNTEDAGGESTSVEDDEDRAKHAHPPLPIRAPAAPSQEPDVGDEQDVEEEEEEDEMDAETRRKLELRERMAKMSGGMGMPGMFGAMPMGGLPPKKKKTGDKKLEEDEERSVPQQRVAMFPMPGMPSVKSPEQEDRQLAVEKEDEQAHPITGSHTADEVPDVEDVASQQTPTAERPPPVPSDTSDGLLEYVMTDGLFRLQFQLHVDRMEGETDYEGDYDTDIASGATHKDALKSHARDESVDESTIADEPSSAQSPTTPHAVRHHLCLRLFLLSHSHSNKPRSHLMRMTCTLRHHRGSRMIDRRRHRLKHLRISMHHPLSLELPHLHHHLRKSELLLHYLLKNVKPRLRHQLKPRLARPVLSQDFIASDIDLGVSSHWWTQPKLLPPSLQTRKDVLVNLSESQSGSTVEKVISILYMDYSQTTVSVQFDAQNVSDVHFEQQHREPPPRQRPDQLENAYEQFGRQIAKAVESKQNTVVGNGTPHGLIDELLKPYQDALPPVSTRAFGALVYANLANASTQSYDEIRPGDIVTFRNAKFQGKTGPMHAKYSTDVGKPDHVGVVVEWDGSKKKVRVWEQGREHKKVKPESFKMGDLRSGEVRVWRVMSKSWHQGAYNASMSAPTTSTVVSSAPAPTPRATFALWVRTGVAHPTQEEKKAVDATLVAALKLAETHARRQRALKAWKLVRVHARRQTAFKAWKLARQSKRTSGWCRNDEL